jgi:hypothetical protein
VGSNEVTDANGDGAAALLSASGWISEEEGITLEGSL